MVVQTLDQTNRADVLGAAEQTPALGGTQRLIPRHGSESEEGAKASSQQVENLIEVSLSSTVPEIPTSN